MGTPQQIANDLLAEHQANRGRAMTLEDYDAKIKPHLDFIGAGAAMTARHARALVCRPEFETLAEDDLAQARTVLENALRNVITAQSELASKAPESQVA